MAVFLYRCCTYIDHAIFGVCLCGDRWLEKLLRHVQGTECRSVSFAGIILRNPRDRWLRPATAFRRSRRPLPSLLAFACVVITDGFHVLLPTVVK